MWFRGLVAVTCVAVLAAVGYYFWGEYERNAESSRSAKIAEERRHCLIALERYATRKLNDPKTEAMLADVNVCVESFLITESDLNAAVDLMHETISERARPQ